MATPFEPPPPPSGTSSGNRNALMLVIAAVVAVLLLVVAGVLVLRGSDDDGDGDGDAAAPGDEDSSVGDFQRPTERRATSTRRGKPATVVTAPEDRLDEGGCPTEGETVDLDSLPDPDVTATPVDLDVSRQGRISEWPIDPFNDVYWPYVGEVFVDVEPGGYVDIPIHIEAGEHVMVFSANDCIRGEMMLFAPDGSLHSQYEDDLGDPGVLEGWEFTNQGGDALTESGTYVIRSVQHTGVTGGHPVRFYAPGG